MERIMAGRNPLTAHDVEWLKMQGITHILDLREPHGWAAPHFGVEALDEIARCGLQRCHLVVEDMGPPTPADLEAACGYFHEVLSDRESRVYVHCRAGMERTAAILVAHYARENRLGYGNALTALRERRPIFQPLPGQEWAVRRWLDTPRKAGT